MKFVTVKIACTVEEREPGCLQESKPGFLELKLTASDNEKPHETLERLARILDEKMNLVDIGDCD